MTAVPVLGDFLAAAHRRLDEPGNLAGTAATGRDVEEVTGSLMRFITVVGRYVGDLQVVRPGETSEYFRHLHGVWRHAAAETLSALAAAALALDHGERIRPLPRGVPCAQARPLEGATAALTVGRDLMQLHFAASRHGPVHRSEWAPVIASPPVSRALLAEITVLTGRVASVVARMPAVRGRTAGARQLDLAGYWLGQAEAAGQTAQRRDPVPAAYQELLYAIPATAVPPRRRPGTAPTARELCEAVTAAASRVRHAAWLAAQADAESPAISVTSWRRVATCGVSTSRHLRVLLAGLAERALWLEDEATGYRLRIVAGSAQATYRAWVMSARQLGEFTTDVQARGSRAAAEAGDLALLTGRLAYARPDWSLSSGPGQRARPAAELAPGAGDIPEVLAAVHYAADSLACLARANHRQARAAVTAQRVLVPARSPDARPGARGSYARPSDERTRSFLRASRDVQDASVLAAESLGAIAMATHAPSRVLAAARAVVGSERQASAAVKASGAGVADLKGSEAAAPQLGVRDRVDRHVAGPVEARLRELGITGERFLARAASIDRTGQQVLAEAATEVLSRNTLPANWARSGVAVEGVSRQSARRSPTVSPQQEIEAEP